MKVLGRAYKENLVLGIIMAVVAVGLFVALGVVLYEATVARIILSAFFFAFALLCLIFFSTLVVLQLLTTENIVLFDENKSLFIVHRYSRVYKIYLADLQGVKYHNKGLQSFGPLFFRREFEYGKISFILRNGKKIVTPNIESVVDACKSIMDLIDRKGESNYVQAS